MLKKSLFICLLELVVKALTSVLIVKRVVKLETVYKNKRGFYLISDFYWPSIVKVQK